VLEATPPVRFVFRWKSDSGLYETAVEIDLVPVHDGTIVRLVEHGFPMTDEGIEEMLNRATGRGETLTLMKFYVERGIRS
jgi:uncharacterized protein YndB with AHSA1/START domain